MPVTLPIWSPDRELIIKYKGVFDMDDLYKTLYKWLHNRKFEWHEPVFKDKFPQSGHEQEIFVHAFRNDTEFLRVNFLIYIHTRGLKDVQVLKEGKQKKMVDGTLHITITVEFEADYEERWEGSKFHEGLREFYINNIINRKIQTYGDKIEYEAHNLQELIKQHLDMQAKGNQFADMY